MGEKTMSKRRKGTRRTRRSRVRSCEVRPGLPDGDCGSGCRWHKLIAWLHCEGSTLHETLPGRLAAPASFGRSVFCCFSSPSRPWALREANSSGWKCSEVFAASGDTGCNVDVTQSSTTRSERRAGPPEDSPRSPKFRPMPGSGSRRNSTPRHGSLGAATTTSGSRCLDVSIRTLWKLCNEWKSGSGRRVTTEQWDTGGAVWSVWRSPELR